MIKIYVCRLLITMIFYFFSVSLKGQALNPWFVYQRLPSFPVGQTDTDPEQERRNMDLLMAVFQNKFDEVVEAIEKGAHANARDYEGLTALMYALYNADDEIIDHLLLNGADINSIDYSGTSVLMHAIMAGQIQFTLENIDSIGAINHRNSLGYTALVYAAENGDLALAEALVNSGGNIHYTTDRGTTPLIHAAAFGNFFLVDFFAFSGAVINHRANDGSTALHMAAYYGHEEVAGLLLSWGADPEMRDNRGNTPLMIAIYGYQLGTVWYLVESGASLHTQNDSGLTPLSLATWLEDFDVVELLFNYEFEEPESKNKRASALAYSFYNRNRHLQRKLMQTSGISPRGLYFSELLLYQGLSSAPDDRMYHAGIGLYEARFRLFLRADFKLRLRDQRVRVPVSPGNTFQFFESRNAWSLGLHHEVILARMGRYGLLGVMPGASAAYTQASYRGTGMEPPGGFAVIPAADVFYHWRSFSLYAGYSYWDTRQQDVSPHRIRAGLAYRFPFFRKRNITYSPVLR